MIRAVVVVGVARIGGTVVVLATATTAGEESVVWKWIVGLAGI